MFGRRQGFNLEANFLPQDHHYACKTNDTLPSKEARNISRSNLVACMAIGGLSVRCKETNVL
mgnify:CR=1 FL=1